MTAIVIVFPSAHRRPQPVRPRQPFVVASATEIDAHTRAALPAIRRAIAATRARHDTGTGPEAA